MFSAGNTVEKDKICAFLDAARAKNTTAWKCIFAVRTQKLIPINRKSLL